MPDLVISGINAGQNMGSVVDLSGTVGAARAAVARGIPALAASQGLGDPPQTSPPAASRCSTGSTANLAAIEAGTLTHRHRRQPEHPDVLRPARSAARSTCPPPTNAEGYNDTPNCASTATGPTDDIQAYLIGFAPLSQLSVTPAAG